MKQLILLLLTISITIFSWSSCAKSTQIIVNSLYIQPTVATPSTVLEPSLTYKNFRENHDITKHNNQNNFFKMTIEFNEKLQQFISFFNHSHNEIKEIVSNTIESSKESISNLDKFLSSGI